MVLLLLDLPGEIFDIIIAFVAADVQFLKCTHTNVYVHAGYGQADANAANNCLPIRLVHSAFRKAIDPHLFRTYCEDIAIPAGTKFTRKHLFSTSQVWPHVRELEISTIGSGQWATEQSRVLKVIFRVEELLQETAERLDRLIFHACLGDANANHWHRLHTHHFDKLRELYIEDPTFAFCVPKIAWFAPQLQHVFLGGYEVDPKLTFDRTREVVEASGVLSDLHSYPLRPIERLTVEFLGEAWMNYFLSVAQPKFMHINFISEVAEWETLLSSLWQGIGYLADWTGLQSFRICEVGLSLEDRAYWSNEVLQKRKDLFETLKETWKGRGIKLSMDMQTQDAKTIARERTFEKATIYT